MAYITSSYFLRYYKNNKNNSIFYFFVLIYSFILIFPFALSYQTEGFWDLMRTYSEQPQISYSGLYAIECQDELQKYVYTNIPSLIDLNNFDVKPSTTSSFVDTNSDSKAEQLNFQLFIPSLLFTPSTCTLLVVYNYGTRGDLKIQMQAPVILQIENDFAKYRSYVNGRLVFNQKNPNQPTKLTRNVYNNTDFTPIEHVIEIEQPIYTSYQIGKNGNNVVEIGVDFKLPVFQKIQYVPRLLENLKISWIQYIFILIPTSYFVNMLALFSIRRQIFFSHVSTNLPLDSNRVRLQ